MRIMVMTPDGRAFGSIEVPPLLGGATRFSLSTREVFSAKPFGDAWTERMPQVSIVDFQLGQIAIALRGDARKLASFRPLLDDRRARSILCPKCAAPFDLQWSDMEGDTLIIRSSSLGVVSVTIACNRCDYRERL